MLPFGLFAQNPDAPCGPNDQGSGIGQQIMNGSVIWDASDGNKIISGDIIVETGTSFTIKNTTVFFTGRTRIIVKRGAKLVLDRATLTSYCNGLMWEGIEVWGTIAVHPDGTSLDNPNFMPQLNGSGYVRIKNSTIENAANAVKTTKIENFGSPSSDVNQTYSNGIVRVFNSIFSNNGCDLVIYGDNYPHENSCAAYDCIFRNDDLFHTNNQINNSTEPTVHIFLKDAFELEGFYKNIFVNFTTIFNGANMLNGGSVLRSFETGFNFVDNQVANYEIGLEVISPISSNAPVVIESNTFNDNKKAVRISGNDGATNGNARRTIFAHNTINFPEFGYPNSSNTDDVFGLRLEACSDYDVYDNTFLGGDSHSTGNGVEIESSHDNATNYVKCNKFGAPDCIFRAGVDVKGENITTNILHNDFISEDNVFGGVFSTIFRAIDIFETTSIYVIAPLQGLCNSNPDQNLPETYAAGNKFFGTASADHNHIFTSGFQNPIFYNHYINEEPNVFFGGSSITPLLCNMAEKYNCDETETTGPASDCRIGKIEQEILAAENEIMADKQMLTEYDRPDFSAQITNSKNINQVLNVIENFDLYLSDKELIAVINKIGELPDNAQLFDILIENGPLKQPVKDALNTQIESLPNQTKNKILNLFENELKSLNKAANNISLRDELKYNILSRIKLQIDILVGNGGGVINCRNQGNEKQVLQTLNKLANNTTENKQWFQKRFIEYAILGGQFADANSMLSDIDTKNEFGMAEYVNYKKIEVQLLADKRDVAELKRDEIVALTSIASTNTYAGFKAKNMLLNYSNPQPWRLESQQLKKASLVEITNSNLYVYPNPANSILNISLNYKLNNEQFNIAIYNVAGTLIDTFDIENETNIQYNVIDYDKGIYILKLHNKNTGENLNTKFTVIK